MAKEICHVIFPGAFKPVHYGHISLILKYLESSVYDVKITIVISRGPREGISAETSKWFLDRLFENNRNVKIIIAPDPSPIKTVYDMICMKEYGDGTYALAASSKGSDLRRAEDIVNQFKSDGKYETDGVKVIFYPVNPEPAMYAGRTDRYEDTPVSATIVRNDIRNADYDSFRTAYLPLMIEDSEYYSRLSEADLKRYYDMLESEILPIQKKFINSSLKESVIFKGLNILNEGGAAGHMSHPYDYTEFTFGDLKSLITDLFTGNVEDVTEKLDGQNLFASVDENGETIFARNETTLKNNPWYIGDIMKNPNWEDKPAVLHAFSYGAMTVDKIFTNIPGRVNFFNTVDIRKETKTRYWVNLEILDMENFNVIPYADSKVSFHNFTSMVQDNDGIWTRVDISPDINSEKMEVLSQAIKKTSDTKFKAQITPEIDLKNLASIDKTGQKYIDYIDTLLDNSDDMMNDDTTIDDYRMSMFEKYIDENPDLNWITGDVKNALLNRWVNDVKKPDIRSIYKTMTLSSGKNMTSDEYDIIRDFEVSKEKDLVMKRIMKPLDTLFIKVGNEILQNTEGLSNAGHESEVKKRLMQTLSDIRKNIENSGDAAVKDKLKKSLARLAEVNNELNSTEGIVFRWRGRLMKLTGSFAPLNQILGVGGRR